MRFLILTLTAGLLFAQDKPPEPKADPKAEPNEAAVIQVKTLTGESFQRLMNLLAVFNARVKGDSEMRTIVVYAPKEVVAQMKQMVQQLDRPGSQAALGRNIEMTLTLLRCTATPASGAQPLPADIEQVAKQLRLATQCKEAQIWDAIPMRIREGNQESREDLRLPTGRGNYAQLSFTVQPEAVYTNDKGRYVRFSKLHIGVQVPVGNGYNNLSLSTSGDFMEGQKTVIGKVSGIGEDESMFAVIALKVLD